MTSMAGKAVLRSQRLYRDAAEAREARSSVGSASNGPTSDAGSCARASHAGSTCSSAEPLPTFHLRLTGTQMTMQVDHGPRSSTGGSSEASHASEVVSPSISVKELRQRYTARIARRNADPVSPLRDTLTRCPQGAGGGMRRISSSGSGRRSSASGSRHTPTSSIRRSGGGGRRRSSSGGSRLSSGGGRHSSGAGRSSGTGQRATVTAFVTATSRVDLVMPPASKPQGAACHAAAAAAALKHVVAKAPPASFDCEADSMVSPSTFRSSGTIGTSGDGGTRITATNTFRSGTGSSYTGTAFSSGLLTGSSVDVHPRSKRVRWQLGSRRLPRTSLAKALRAPGAEGAEGQRAAGLTEEAWMRLRNTAGQIVNMPAFLKVIQDGGIEPHIRPAVWPLLLGLVGPTDSELTKRAKWAAAARDFEQLCVLAESDTAAAIFYELQGAQEPWLVTKRRIVTDAVRTASDGPLFRGSPRSQAVARLERLLLAYALHDPPTGYCQGMADLAAPFVHLYDNDAEAFAVYRCMLHPLAPNFQEGLAAISGQLRELRAILAALEGPLLRHLERIGAATFESAFQMLLLLFRRELSWSATFTFWEALWAAEAAARAPLRVYAVAALFSTRREELLRAECLEDVVIWANGIGSSQDPPLDPIALAADAYTMWRYVSTAAAASERAATRCGCVPPVRLGARARECRAAAEIAAAVAASGGSSRLLAFGPSV